MSQLLKEEKYVIKLGGKDYELSPVNLNILSAIDDEFDGFGGLVEQVKTKQSKTILSLLWIMLRDKYPDLTKESIGSQVKTFKEIKAVSDKLFSVLKESME